MVTQQGNMLQEAVDIVQRAESRHGDVMHWACDICGMVQSGANPSSCDSCGVTDAFSPRQDVRSEIGRRW